MNFNTVESQADFSNEPISKYFLFGGGDAWEKSGGWDDFIGRFDSIESAKELIGTKRKSFDLQWYHLVRNDGVLIEKWDYEYGEY